MNQQNQKNQHALGGNFTFAGTSITVKRMGYGAMQLASPHVFGPPKDRAGAVTVLREAIESGVNHINTSDFYGPHVTNQITSPSCHLPSLKRRFSMGLRRSPKRRGSSEHMSPSLQTSMFFLGFSRREIVWQIESKCYRFGKTLGQMDMLIAAHAFAWNACEPRPAFTQIANALKVVHWATDLL